MKVYVMADSFGDYLEALERYNNDESMDCSGLDFEYLDDVGQVTEASCEIWDCSSLRKNITQKGFEISYDM